MKTKNHKKLAAWLVGTALAVGGAVTAAADPGDTTYRRGQSSISQQQATSMARGQVIATKEVRLRGSNQRNIVALVQPRQGARILVDLGPRTQAQRLDLRPGDQLVARGHYGMVRGRTVLVADRAQAGGQQLFIDRAAQRSGFRAMKQAHPGMRSRSMQHCPPGSG